MVETERRVERMERPDMIIYLVFTCLVHSLESYDITNPYYN
jgi:hypothetical protein